jgi:hypothetical protein
MKPVKQLSLSAVQTIIELEISREQFQCEAQSTATK